MKVAKHVPDVEPCVNGKRGVLKRHIERQHNKTSQMSSSDEDESQLQDIAKRKTSNSVLNSVVQSSPSTSGFQNTVGKNTVSTTSAQPSKNSNDVDATPSDSSASKNMNPRQNPMNRRNRQRQLEGLDRMEQRLKDLRAGNIEYVFLDFICF